MSHRFYAVRAYCFNSQRGPSNQNNKVFLLRSLRGVHSMYTVYSILHNLTVYCNSVHCLAPLWIIVKVEGDLQKMYVNSVLKSLWSSKLVSRLMQFKRPVYILAFGVYNSKQVNVSGIQIFPVQFLALHLRTAMLNAANIYLFGIHTKCKYIYRSFVVCIFRRVCCT